MASVRRFQLQCLFYLALINLLSPAALLASSSNTTSPPPDCPGKCGDITIPYPFGTIHGCYRDGFNVTCDDSVTPPKAILGQDIEVLDINITSAEARVYSNIGYCCYNNQTSQEKKFKTSINTTSLKPFLISNRRNKFTVIGCDTFAYISGNQAGNSSYRSGCASFCQSLDNTDGDGGSCNGLGCCQSTIPEGLYYYTMTWGLDKNQAWSYSPCMYAVLLEDDWYKFQVEDLREKNFLTRTGERVPFVLDWAIRDSGICLSNNTEQSSKPACLSEHSRCDNTTNGKGYICKCLQGYEGNPYIQNGCTDIDECKSPEVYPCMGDCMNKDGSYDCACPKGKEGNAKAGSCTRIAYSRKRLIGMIILLGFLIGFSILLVYFAIAKRLKLFEKRKQEKLKQKFFVENRGLLLQQLLVASPEDTTQKMKIIRLDELEKATNRFDNELILGRGGHGEVYKGILSDQRVVAIKKSKIVDQTEIDQFLNEVVILSQINHRNIVKLYGCCLESEVPLLAYEFISNGTLFNHLHVEEHCSLTWKHRLRIVLETAGAISYLHSSASISIFHRDIKSSNILLDDYFTAKVSDFGASRSVQIDQTGVTTAVQGTYGYMDPEYYCTGRLTPKSDVYSFGVILAELLTRERPIVSSRKFKGGSLIAYFISAMKENRLFEILDPQIVNEGHRTELEAVAKLAEMCLKMKGEERPAMKEVEVQLEILWRSNQQQKNPCTSQSLEERWPMRLDYTAGTDTTLKCSFEQEQQSTTYFSM